MSNITTWDEAVESFESMLDETTGPVKVAGIEWDASRVLREMDPIAFRCGLFDYLDGEGVDSDDLDGDLDI